MKTSLILLKTVFVTRSLIGNKFLRNFRCRQQIEQTWLVFSLTCNCRKVNFLLKQNYQIYVLRNSERAKLANFCWKIMNKSTNWQQLVFKMNILIFDERKKLTSQTLAEKKTLISNNVKRKRNKYRSIVKHKIDLTLKSNVAKTRWTFFARKQKLLDKTC